MTVKEIEEAIAKLPQDQLAELRTWFEAFDAELLDAAIERDAKTSKLDRLAAEALAEHAAGRSREL